MIMGHGAPAETSPAVGMQYTQMQKRLHYTPNATRLHMGVRR